MESLDVTTIVFAIVAIFVVFKLRSVLGTRSGPERRPPDPTTPPPLPPATSAPNVIQFGANPRVAAPVAPPADRWRGFAEPDSPVAAGLDQIAAREPQFNPGDFLSGARSAYEMIIGAFAAGDLNALRRLLASDVFANFARAIEARRAAEQTLKTTLVAIDAADIVDARVVGRVGSIAVRFASKLISSTTDASGQVIEGSATEVADHLDVWTFSRALGSRDPNWALTATETVR